VYAHVELAEDDGGDGDGGDHHPILISMRACTLACSVGPEEAGAVECYPMRTDVDLIANFSSSDPFLDSLRRLNRNTFDR
jgi:hypothetical protein